MSSTDTRIDRVEAWRIPVPLATPIVLGSLRIAIREFVVVRVRTAGGIDGVAYSLTRNSPLDLVITDVSAPSLLGKDALLNEARVAEMTSAVSHLGPVGLVGRAISLLEICLWDIKGQVAGLPVHRLLGGARDEAPVQVVAPYALPDEDHVRYADRIIPVAERGYRVIKLYPLSDPREMTKRLAAIRSAVGEDVGLVVDMAWSFPNAREAIDAVAQWERFGLTWVEDPFPSWEPIPMRLLSEAVTTPIAAGDEVSVPAVMETLITERAVDVVRLDATSIGGFSRFGEVAAKAHRAGYQVSHHAYGELQQHCVFAWRHVTPVELFLPGSPTLGTSQFLAQELDLPPGATMLPAPTAPGVGLSVDWGRVETLATRHSTTG